MSLSRSTPPKRPQTKEAGFYRWWKKSGFASLCPANGPDNEAFLAARTAWLAGCRWEQRRKK